MRFQRHHRYPVPPAVLIEHLMQPRCYEMRFHIHPDNPDSKIELWHQGSDGLRIRILKQVPVQIEKLPRLLKPFLTPVMPFYSEFFWLGHQPGQHSNNARGEYRLWIGKVPLRVDGMLEVHGSGNESEQTLRAEITSRIPLMGNAMLERALPMVNALLEADHQAVLDYLGRTTGGSAVAQEAPLRP